jgi:uncharacterized membrane protein YqjE
MTIALLIGLKVLPLAIAILVVAVPKVDWRENVAAPVVIYTLIAILWTLDKLGFKDAPLTEKQRREVFHDIWG